MNLIIKDIWVVAEYLSADLLRMRKHVFDSGLFKCTAGGQCTPECLFNIKTNKMIEKLRTEFVKKGIYPEKHFKTAERIKKEGSPF